MKMDSKTQYFLRSYKTENKCTCKECGNLVFKANVKGYDYNCLKCGKALFNNQVNISSNKIVPEDIKLMKETIVKYL